MLFFFNQIVAGTCSQFSWWHVLVAPTASSGCLQWQKNGTFFLPKVRSFFQYPRRLNCWKTLHQSFLQTANKVVSKTMLYEVDFRPEHTAVSFIHNNKIIFRMTDQLIHIKHFIVLIIKTHSIMSGPLIFNLEWYCNWLVSRSRAILLVVHSCFRTFYSFVINLCFRSFYSFFIPAYFLLIFAENFYYLYSKGTWGMLFISVFILFKKINYKLLLTCCFVKELWCHKLCACMSRIIMISDKITWLMRGTLWVDNTREGLHFSVSSL